MISICSYWYWQYHNKMIVKYDLISQPKYWGFMKSSSLCWCRQNYYLISHPSFAVLFLCWFFFPLPLRCRFRVFIGDFLPPQPTSLPYLPGIMIFMKIGINLCVLVGLGCRYFNFPSLLYRRTFSSRGRRRRRRRIVHVETTLQEHVMSAVQWCANYNSQQH